MAMLIESALRALVVALTVWAGLRLFRLKNVAAQKIAWGLVLVCAAAMPAAMRWSRLHGLLTVPVPASLAWTHARPAPLATAAPEPAVAVHAVQIEPRLRPARSAEGEPVIHGGARDLARAVKAGDVAATANPQTAINPTPAASPGRFAVLRSRALRMAGQITLVELVYFPVCAFLLLRILCGLAMALRLWWTAERFEPEPGPDPLVDPGRGLRLRFSFAVASPVTIGSAVLLPADYLAWDREKLRIVLAHERAHVRQGDFYLQLAAGLYAAVFWFSPLGWWLKRTLCDLGEAISDRAGLEQAASRISYAQVLLEFAAMPRPTLIGVAMARKSNLAQRMERFLNDSHFRQAFAGGRGRILLAVLLVPAALLAGTALVRVEAAPRQTVQAPPAPPVAPTPAAVPTSASVPAPAAAPDLAPSPDPEPAPQAVPPPPPAAPLAPEAAEARYADDEHEVSVSNSQSDTATNTSVNANGKHWSAGSGKGYSYSYSSDGDSWALVTDSSHPVSFNGDWNEGTRAELDRARKLASGKFLWFTHNGKAYFVDDLTLIAQIQEMYKPMDELGRQQEILARQQEALGRQQEALGRRQEQATIPTPDISKEMAQLNQAAARLDARKGSTVSQEELADLEGKLGEIQGRLGLLQGGMGAKQGELGEQQGKLGEEQGRLGAEQGRIGAQQGKLAEEANQRVKSIIDRSVRDGKAKPVE